MTHHYFGNVWKHENATVVCLVHLECVLIALVLRTRNPELVHLLEDKVTEKILLVTLFG